MAKYRYKTEYQVRLIDEHGDAIDMPYSDTAKGKAMDYLNRLAIPGRGVVAAVVEAQKYRELDGDGESMDMPGPVLASRGDERALRIGGWID